MNILSVLYAGIAQSVEQLIRNEQVAGSSPITSSKAQCTAFKLCIVAIAKREKESGTDRFESHYQLQSAMHSLQAVLYCCCDVKKACVNQNL